MRSNEREKHWDKVYSARAENEVSWFQATPAISFDLIAKSGVARDARIIDIGGGASRLVDFLLEEGFSDITVLDVAGMAFDRAKARLGSRAAAVNWIVADVTLWKPSGRYKLWHDRAVFHFLVEAKDRDAYRQAMLAAIEPGGFAIIATFAPDGPERCSGLPVMRYSGASLAGELGGDFRLLETVSEDHRTPAGATQRFQFSRLQRR
jgi:trans-aconitate methyltransferase